MDLIPTKREKVKTVNLIRLFIFLVVYLFVCVFLISNLPHNGSLCKNPFSKNVLLKIGICKWF